MIYEKKECSPLAKLKIKPDAVDSVGTEVRLREKYPFSELAIGQCFVIPMGETTNEMSLRVQVSAKSKVLRKKFTVIKHADQNQCFEIARIA